MPNNNTTSLFIRLQDILRRIADINKEVVLSESSAKKEIEYLVNESVNELKNLEGEIWYLKENKAHERRNSFISLLPFAVGVVLMSYVFFWTLPISARNKSLENTIANQNDSIVLMKKRLVDIYHRSSDGLALQGNQYGNIKRSADSIFNRIRIIVDSSGFFNP